MTKKPTKTKTKTPASKITRAIVLFGLDENGKPRAARFIDDNENLIARLAQALGLRMGIATGSKHTDNRVVIELHPGTVEDFDTLRVVALGVGGKVGQGFRRLVGGDRRAIFDNIAVHCRNCNMHFTPISVIHNVGCYSSGRLTWTASFG